MWRSGCTLLSALCCSTHCAGAPSYCDSNRSFWMAPTVFVTGGDRGLGFALCAGLLEQGWQVFAGQFMPEWPDLSHLAGQYSQMLHIIPLDVSRVESVQAAAQTVAALTDQVDVLINNAGIYAPIAGRPIREPQDYTEMHRLYDVNAL